ncbi:hypothetical protein Q3G72_030634 [Acer saccharum]|nr:hypothetical protein Q3G72_030634 [Acer saccharum]
MQDSGGNTPLHMAIRNRHLKVVQELIAVDPEPVLSVNRVGQSPLPIVIDASSTDITHWIISNKLDSFNYGGISNQIDTSPLCYHKAKFRYHSRDIECEKGVHV